MKIFLALFLLGILVSCTKELKYTKEELLAKAQTTDSTVTVILPKSLSEGVSCSDYTEGCLSAHIVQVRGLDFIALEFNTEAQAIFAAKKVRGFYIRNWVFDDVKGEPMLEKFVSQAFEAKIP